MSLTRGLRSEFDRKSKKNWPDKNIKRKLMKMREKRSSKASIIPRKQMIIKGMYLYILTF